MPVATSEVATASPARYLSACSQIPATDPFDFWDIQLYDYNNNNVSFDDATQYDPIAYIESGPLQDCGWGTYGAPYDGAYVAALFQ
jgi:hypothetical protein